MNKCIYIYIYITVDYSGYNVTLKLIFCKNESCDDIGTLTYSRKILFTTEYLLFENSTSNSIKGLGQISDNK